MKVEWLAFGAVALLTAVTIAAPFIGIAPIVSLGCAALAVVIAVWSATSTRGRRVKR